MVIISFEWIKLIFTHSHGWREKLSLLIFLKMCFYFVAAVRTVSISPGFQRSNNWRKKILWKKKKKDAWKYSMGLYRKVCAAHSDSLGVSKYHWALNQWSWITGNTKLVSNWFGFSRLWAGHGQLQLSYVQHHRSHYYLKWHQIKRLWEN